MSDFSVDAESLTLRTLGLLTDSQPHIRQTLYDEIEARLPREGESRVNIQLSELNPGRTASWHIHNGVVFFVVLRGLVSLHYERRTEHYAAGDVYTEPVGVVHRAFNPHDEIPASFIGFWVTAADRPHITEVGEPKWSPVHETHPML